MIKLFCNIETIEKKLNQLLKEGGISDYKILLTLNNTTNCYVISNDNSIMESLKEEYPNVEFKIISQQEYRDNEDIYESIFSSKDKVNVSSTQKHLSNLLNPIEKNTRNEFPVITFYSYKGGVGRSTTLASCAAYLSNHYEKKVVILDCDFEAPGFTNFFIENPSHPVYKNGLVEFFIDSQDGLENIVLKDYYWEVSKFYSGKGSIYVFPAGNLDVSESVGKRFPTNLIHYLNGLTRLDTFSKDVLVEQFRQLFELIKNDINPDVLLIDSRTGFNDIFGVSAFRLSNCVVGFFGNNEQTYPGLYFFLNLLKQENCPNLILANSIIPAQGKRRWFKSFEDTVNGYLLSFPVKDNPYSIKMFPIPYSDVLKVLGTIDEDREDYIDIIQGNTFPDYNALFDAIYDVAEDNKADINNKTNDIKKHVTSTIEQSKAEPQLGDSSSKESEARKLKVEILKDLQENMPKLYAEDIEDFDIEFKEKRYFYRECMEDLFNPDKILVIGNKGTGKSYIYRSLKNQYIVSELRERANKESNDYMFIHAVERSSKMIDTIKFDSDDFSNGTDLFFERFWTVYIWDAIMLEKPYGYETSLDVKAIKDDNATAEWFRQIIQSNEQVMKIEEDLSNLDKYLYHNNKEQIVIIFDDLDVIVKPHKWSERISPLINLCKKMSFNCISPKLFLRSDLYDKITNINNKNELENRTIDIEWNRQELFAYFFKLVLSNSKDRFFRIMQLYDYPHIYTNKVKSNLTKAGNQPPLDDYTLKHLCSVFFGKYADTKGSPKFGESYDWFFLNLKNANGTISLRPFIDLLTISIREALKKDKTEIPILSPLYYTNGQARSEAVENHFKDLASERGNVDLIPIFDYIRDKASHRYKKEQLTQQEFFELLDLILDNCDLKDNHTKDQIIDFLTINGIIRSKFIRLGNSVHKNYQFALLYKYYLGLQSRDRRKRR